MRDELTRLFNRRYFYQRLQRELDEARDLGNTLGVVLLDVDDLKGINDTFGHPAGDQALVEAANMLRATFRETDIIARMGGDEFAVLLADSDGCAEEIGSRLEQEVELRHAETGTQFQLSLSIGLSCFDPDNPQSLARLLLEADRALYRRKQDREC